MRSEPQSLPDDSREIRVFLSSTFKDMDEERNILMQRVFPELRRLCSERAVALTEIDLRWGVTEEASKNGQTVEICLQEIDHCRKFPPFFIGFLGERYGWVPQHGELQAYWEKHSDSPYAHRIQQALEQGISVTELEMRYGIWEGGVGVENAWVFLRAPDLTQTLADGHPHDDFYDDGGGKLQAFKAQLRKQPGLLAVDGYSSVEAFADAVQAALLQAIDQRYPKAQTPSIQQICDRAHCAYAQSRLRAYVPDPQIDQRIKTNLQDQANAPATARRLHVSGASGLGKSALLAHTAQALREQGYWVHEHYVGADGDRSLAGWRERLRGALPGTTETEIQTQDTQQQDPWAALDQALEKAQSQLQQPMLLLLDALDQLHEPDKALVILAQRILPPQVFLLHSATPDLVLSLPEPQRIELQPLDAQRRQEAITRFLTQTYRKSLEERQGQRLSQAEACGNPLFLRLLLEELRLHARFETLDQEIEALLASGTVDRLFAQVLAAMDRDFADSGHAHLARELVTYLTLSYRGLHKNDLAVLLGSKTTRLADAQLIPLLARLEPYLLQDAGRLRLLHAALREPLEQGLNADEAATQDLRRRMMVRLDGETIDQRIERIHQAIELGDQTLLLGGAGLASLKAAVSLQKETPELLITALRLLGGGQHQLPEAVTQLAQGWAGQTEDAEAADAANSLAFLFHSQGLYALAEPLYQRALAISEKVLGPEHPDTAASLNNLAMLYDAQGRLNEAEPLYQRALAIWEKVLGPEYPNTATSLNNLASLYQDQGRLNEAEPLYQRALAIRERVLGPEHPDTASSLNNLALLYKAQGRLNEAEPLYQRALAIWEKVLGPEHPDTATSLNNLASLYKAQGRLNEAEPLLQRALAIWEKVLGPEHPDTAASLNSLAGLYQDQGRLDEAEPLYQRALAICEKVFGPEHPDTASSLNSLAGLYQDQGRLDEAEPLYQRALAIREKVFGPEHPDTATSLNNLALLYQDQGRLNEAEPLYQRDLAISEKVLGPEHPDTATSLNNLAALYKAQGRLAEAEPLYQRALAIREKVLGPEHPDTATSLNNLAMLYQAQGRLNEAEPLYQRALAIWEKVLGPEHPNTASSLNNLALLYQVQGRLNEAEPLYQRALAIWEKVLGPEHPNTATSLNNLAALYDAQGRLNEAEPLLQRSLAISEKALGPEHPNTATSLNNLAALYDAQGRLNEAEPLYQRALAISEKVLGPEHPDTATSLNNLALLYLSMKKIDQALPLLKRAREIFALYPETAAQAEQVQAWIEQIRQQQ
ncbi:tetratricopeptide repeat protein [Acidithiobacillus marinus]|nr:tetratricopeptide repeat protein [Acidithiobacillus marinus]